MSTVADDWFPKHRINVDEYYPHDHAYTATTTINSGTIEPSTLPGSSIDFCSVLSL